MRILFWSGNFWPQIGGAEVLAAKLLPALRERGYEFVVVTLQQSPDQPAEDRYKGIPIYRFPLRGNYSSIDQLTAGVLKVKQQVIKLKHTFAPDLIHLSAVDIGSFFHVITADAHPTPLLVTLHNVLPGQAVGHTSWLGRLIRAADWITCVSAAVLAETRQLVPEITPRSSVIYNGLDAPSLPPEPLPLEIPRLLCLGRLAREKGFDLALNALASIIDRFPHARLVIAGDGPERPQLERQIAELGLTDVVDLIGWVAPAEVPALINITTMVLMPSWWEGLPSVALQAALMARPVVATRVGGLPEAVVHQQTGLLVEPEDCVGLAEAIAFLLEHPAVTVQMGQAARRLVHDVFGWQRCVDAYDALYRELAKKVIRCSSQRREDR